MIMLKVTNRASGRLGLRTVKVVLSSPHERNPRQSGIQDSTPWNLDFRYWIPGALSVERVFQTPVVSWIPDC